MVILAEFPPWLIGLTAVLFLIVSALMVLTVLIQRPAGGGLSGAFGSGAGSGQTAFGAKTGDALTIATISVFIAYLIIAVVLNFGTRPPDTRAGAPVAAPAPATAGTGAAPATGAGAPTSTGATGAVFTPPPAPASTGQTGSTAATGSTAGTGAAPSTGPAPATGAPASTGN